jgi:hypothetical protein
MLLLLLLLLIVVVLLLVQMCVHPWEVRGRVLLREALRLCHSLHDDLRE